MTEIDLLRKQQAERVMPLLGNLIDRWELIPNDLRGCLEAECSDFYRAMCRVQTAMERE